MTPPIIALCIATTGRASTLTETLKNVVAQTRPVDRIILSPAKEEDIDEPALGRLPLAVQIVRGASGLTAQRNAILHAAGMADIILFLDDDFLVASDYIAKLEDLFVSRPDCVVATGRVLADGATNSGYSATDGRSIIARYVSPARPQISTIFNAYGCNMAIRWSRLRGTDCLFDERLPLYGWAEDVDFSRQAARYGSVLLCESMVGVHLAEKKGRVSGVRFGYSQIANQIYLARKGTITIRGGVRKIAENVAANMIGAILSNETCIDRRGRLAGNLRGLSDLVAGRSSPNRIFEL